MRPGVPPDESSSWGYFRPSRYLPVPLSPVISGDAGGNAVQIPAGSTARSARNGNGVVYQPPVGPNQDENANAIRVSGPDKHQPTGSITVHGPTGQPLNPATGKPDTKVGRCVTSMIGNRQGKTEISLDLVE
jgi:hypothetical protein